MSDPLVTPDDLSVYLNDPNINEARALAMIADAQAECELRVAPLPAAAAFIVKRVAARGYVTTTVSKQAQMAAAGSPFGGGPGSTGGIWLTRQDKTDLRLVAGGGGAFAINCLPADYTLPPQPLWDVDGDEFSLFDAGPTI